MCGPEQMRPECCVRRLAGCGLPEASIPILTGWAGAFFLLEDGPPQARTRKTEREAHALQFAKKMHFRVIFSLRNFRSHALSRPARNGAENEKTPSSSG